MRIPYDLISQAKDMAAEAGAMNRHSFLAGDGNVTGYIGELIFDRLHPCATRIDTYDADFTFRGKTVDVKSRTMFQMPRPDYDITVKVVKEIRADYFYFIGVDMYRRVGYLLGWMDRARFMICPKVKTGDLVGGAGSYKAGGYRVRVGDLVHATPIIGGDNGKDR